MLSLCLSAFQRLVEKMLFAPDEKIGRGEERGEGGRGEYGCLFLLTPILIVPACPNS